MQLYYSKGACSLACRIIINEIGEPCQYQQVNLQTKQTQEGKDFTKINPKGAVPTLQTDEGDILTENAAILQYLADKAHAHQLLPNINDFNRYQVISWVNYIATELHKGFSPLFHNNFSKDIQEQILIPALVKKFQFIDQHLANRTFLLGDNFTLPDAYLFVILRWTHHFKIFDSSWQNITRYYAELDKRESIKLSLSQEGL